MGGMNTALFVCSVPLPDQPTPSIDPRVRFTNLVNWWYCDGETRTLLFVFVLFLLTCRSLAWGRGVRKRRGLQEHTITINSQSLSWGLSPGKFSGASALVIPHPTLSALSQNAPQVTFGRKAPHVTYTRASSELPCPRGSHGCKCDFPPGYFRGSSGCFFF